MLNVKNLIKAVSSITFVASLGLVGIGTVNAASTAAPLGSAEVEPTNPVAKKGDKIFVVVKDSKNQKVNVVNAKNHTTGEKVKMGYYLES